MSPTERPAARAARKQTGPAPIFERLPHGPHRLGAEQVVRNQRARMHGAMVEAVATSGYERTSVKQVVALAGVSRRSFYEQFANKQECFLSTYDVIATRGAGRVNAAYRAADGDAARAPAGRLRRARQAIRSNWKSASLVIARGAEGRRAAGLLRLRRALGDVRADARQLLRARAPMRGPLPVPVIRGIAGGLHAAMSRCLREESPQTAPQLAEEMFRWTLLFQTPAARAAGGAALGARAQRAGAGAQGAVAEQLRDAGGDRARRASAAPAASRRCAWSSSRTIAS